jgi:hypothetical protein
VEGEPDGLPLVSALLDGQLDVVVVEGEHNVLKASLLGQSVGALFSERSR